MKRPLFYITLLIVLLTAAISPAAAQDGNPLLDPVEILVPEIISEHPHDPLAFTQGLLWHEGSFFESTGQRGESTLREVDPETGEVLRAIDIDETYFAEGLERIDDRLIQLTWEAGVAFVYDLETFEQIDTFEYEGEGWGLCYDGTYLFMSDGSPFLEIRDPDTFEVIFRGLVTSQGRYVNNINELECVGDHIYANIWTTDYIIKIDKTNGVVVAVIDATGLLDEEAASASNVLNGIAYNPKTDTFWITGKDWPMMFEVRFVPKEEN